MIPVTNPEIIKLGIVSKISYLIQMVLNLLYIFIVEAINNKIFTSVA